jgi:predicted DCC family thiol-disulfide oxidoreductase YuxK
MSLPRSDPDRPIVLFDGECNLCNGGVNFIIDRDPEARFRFASLQSEAGAALLEAHGLGQLDMSTMVLIEGDEVYVRGRAVLRIAQHLGGVFRLAALLRPLPTSALDTLYGAVASHRYSWFGRSDTCRVPTPELRARFL